MKKIRTHYDNLKVARNAPQEIIRAAYKTLAQKYHPDKNIDKEESEKVMAILNRSFEILSNPETRKEHDIWITNQENSDKNQSSISSSGSSGSSYKDVETKKNNFWIWYIFVFLLIFSLVKEYLSENNNAPVHSEKSRLSEIYMRPKVAPNGFLWPNESAYLEGYPILRLGGNSRVNVNNDTNYDLYIKFISNKTDGDLLVLRHIYLPRNSSFIISDVKDDSYKLDILILDNGYILTSDELKANKFGGEIEVSIYHDSSNNVNLEIVDESIHE